MDLLRYAIAPVGEPDLPDLLPLMRGYCDFYAVGPGRRRPARARAGADRRPRVRGRPADRPRRRRAGGGFATVYWSWSTTGAGRIGVMNDLFVAEPARGSGLADALIEACRDLCAAHGAGSLGWQTARDNRRAQAVYERLGAHREEWVDYWLPVPSRTHRRRLRPCESSSHPSTSAPRRGAWSAGRRSPRRPPARPTSTWACSASRPGARSRPHYHDACESAVYMLSGRAGDPLGRSPRADRDDRAGRHGLRPAQGDPHPREPLRGRGRRVRRRARLADGGLGRGPVGR